MRIHGEGVKDNCSLDRIIEPLALQMGSMDLPKWSPHRKYSEFLYSYIAVGKGWKCHIRAPKIQKFPLEVCSLIPLKRDTLGTNERSMIESNWSVISPDFRSSLHTSPRA